jgi:hypothetical protein
MVGEGLQKQGGADRFKDRTQIDKIKSNQAGRTQK